MSDTGDSPFIEEKSALAPVSGEFSLRPLRIQKRPDLKEKKDKSSSSTLKQAIADEFVCRPMRLGLLTTPNRSWSGEIKQAADQTALQEGKTGEKSPNSSRTSTVDTPPTSHSRRASIHIKNLPIVTSPRRFLAPEPVLNEDLVFAVCLVDFHHVRGPEIQWWRLNYHQLYDSVESDILFKNLPFQALPDGLHLFEETFSNFNLVYDFDTRQSLDNLADIESFKGNPTHLETLFGCSCVRQVKTADLSETELERNKDITRSIVQKAVVVISRKQPIFTKIKEKLSIITHSFFEQDSFGNFELLESLFDNLNDVLRDKEGTATKTIPLPESQLVPEKYEAQEEYFVNLNLRELLSQFKTDLLVILKALLLEKKVLVYSNNNLELLTQFQNNMIALVPNLINNLELSGCPLSDYTEKNSPLEKPTTLKTNDRMSMLRFFGLPLQIFNTKGNFWNPYLPLQQMDMLRAKSFMVGCSNLLIVNQLARFGVDVLVDLDTWAVTYPCGKPAELKLSAQDKKYVSVLLGTGSTGKAYVGSDDYIRYQFEDYIRSLLATARFQQYVDRFGLAPPGFDSHDKRLGNLREFNLDFIGKWQQTRNFEIWNSTCDEFIFNFHLPMHFAMEMSDQGTGYNLSGFLSSFKKAPQPSNLAEKANLYFSHAQQPRKFITSDETMKVDSNSGNEQAEQKEAAKSAWWGFKK
ncbi:Transport protein Avl9 [Metschnikowia aff. pulcherrima]|uniref:Transport protein Avl9 n=1 Tax=Metschnikowia aff. pulcherrima TaxID=2163413 RepID=A0A4P6XLI9_9ASCO|nr:Transport protein Avl9 [Metschnikowia aff. pulcherrima]